MAVFEAERWKRNMHHLGLSVEEAWERGKRCTECGLSKELRDFSRNARLVNGVGGICRGCKSDKYYALPKNRPSDEPQECTFCHESKPASEFFKRRDGRRGLHSHCKSCVAKRRDDLTRELQSREVVKHVPKMTKQCGVCMENKPTTAFLPRITSSDGLMRDCKVCQNAERRRWRLGRKLKGTKGSVLETTQ